jgi:hypothetical protein
VARQPPAPAGRAGSKEEGPGGGSPGPGDLGRLRCRWGLIGASRARGPLSRYSKYNVPRYSKYLEYLHGYRVLRYNIDIM